MSMFYCVTMFYCTFSVKLLSSENVLKHVLAIIGLHLKYYWYGLIPLFFFFSLVKYTVTISLLNNNHPHNVL